MNTRLLRQAVTALAVAFAVAFAAGRRALAGDGGVDFGGARGSADAAPGVSGAGGASHVAVPLPLGDVGASLRRDDPESSGLDADNVDWIGAQGPFGRPTLHYRSDMPQLRPAGVPQRFWLSPFVEAAKSGNVDGSERADIQLPDGTYVVFSKAAGGADWTQSAPPSGWPDAVAARRYVLKETPGYLWLMDPVDELVYLIEVPPAPASARLLSIMDRRGNSLSYSYVGESSEPSRIEDGLGRSLDFGYAQVSFLTAVETITDQAGRRTTFSYEASGNDNGNSPTLRTITDPAGRVTTLGYAGTPALRNRLSRIELPGGEVPWRATYGDAVVLAGQTASRVTSVQDALGNTTTLTYDAAANVVRALRPDGNTWAYRHWGPRGLPQAITDPSGRATTSTRTTSEQIADVTDRLGRATRFAWHFETGKLASVTDPLGRTTSATYTGIEKTFLNPYELSQAVFRFYDRTRIDHPDGTSTSFTYDDAGNATSVVDPRGGTTTYTYDARGRRLTETNAEGGITTHGYDSSGQRTSTTRADGVTTTYTYDAEGRVQSAHTTDGGAASLEYDAADRVTAFTDAGGRRRTFGYDANGDRASDTDPAGNAVQATRDAAGRITGVTDRRGNATTAAYDALGQPTVITDPTGAAVRLTRNADGDVESFALGSATTSLTRDAEGQVLSRQLPSGGEVTGTYDAAGNLLTCTDPLGGVSQFQYDAMDRVTRVTDPVGDATQYQYDAAGNLTRVTFPAGAATLYAYDALGNLKEIRDAESAVWLLNRGASGRLESLRDPNGRVWQQTYDQRGRPALTLFPFGTSGLQRIRDSAGNVIARIHSGPGGDDVTTFAWDSSNRLVATDGLQLTRDADGRVTASENPGTVFGATYDAAGRVKTVSYADGAFTVTYAYDAATGRLTSATDDLTSSRVDWVYDAAGRVTAVERSNGVDASYEYDAADRLVRLRDGSFLDLRSTYDAAGRVVRSESTAPLDASGFLAPGDEEFGYDPASQLATEGYSYDSRGRLAGAPGGRAFAWDGSSRLTAVDLASFAYNGLGDLRTRTEGGTTVRWYHNYAIRGAPAVAERDEASGDWLRWYVWSPAGELLYVIEATAANAVSFPHFDRTGSTVALTDGTGAVTDAYAYDPYGRLVAHQGASVQPFTFVGRWGVRQEGADGAYQMRLRYYDAVTARFLSPEPRWPAITDPRRVEPYGYALRNPLSFIDPSGAVPTSVPYSGQLAEDGELVSTSSATDFRIVGVGATSGVSYRTGGVTVTVSNGAFSVMLGDTPPAPVTTGGDGTVPSLAGDDLVSMMCGPCPIEVPTAGARRKRIVLGDLVADAGGTTRSTTVGFGVVVVGGGDPDGVNMQVFTVNSHTSAFDMAVFGYEPQPLLAAGQ